MHASPRSDELAIEAEGLVKVFGETRAVDGIDLAVPTGTVYGVLGPNGAGKTTTIRMLATLLRPDGGAARVLRPRRRRARPTPSGPASASPASSPPSTRTSPARRTWCCSAACSASRQPGRRERAAELLDAFGLDDAADRQVKTVLRRHAPPPRHRRQHRRHTRPALPRRADHRPRPAQPQPGLGHRAGARRRGHHRAAHHPVPRRGRPARRPDRRHRPRPGDRRGHAAAS